MTAGSGYGAPSRSRAAGLVVFAAAMGWLEGVVVVYIRGLIGLTPADGMPDVAEVMQRIHTLPWLLPTEQSRETATMAMLAAAAWLAGNRFRPRLGAFLVAFGVWDIVYYVALVVLLRWPPSLATMDVLFLIPPSPLWHQPVWVPIAISTVMIAFGLRLYLGRPAPVRTEGPPDRP